MHLIGSCVGGAGVGSDGAVLCKAGIWSHSELHGPQRASGNVIITQVYYSDEKIFTVNSETLRWTVWAYLKYSLGKNNQACKIIPQLLESGWQPMKRFFRENAHIHCYVHVHVCYMMYVCKHACHNSHVEVGGKLHGVDFLLPPLLGFQGSGGLQSPGGKCLTL